MRKEERIWKENILYLKVEMYVCAYTSQLIYSTNFFIYIIEIWYIEYSDILKKIHSKKGC